MNHAALSRLFVLAAAAALSSGCGEDSRPASAHAVETSRDRSPHVERGPEVGRAPESGIVLELGEDALRDLRLTTRKVERRPAGDTLTVVGSLEVDPNRLAAVSAPIAARVTSITKRVGDAVAAGEELVVLDSPELSRARSAADASRARVAIARTRLDLAEKQGDRLRELAVDHMATVRDVQSAEAEQASRAADLAECEVALREAERALAALPGVATGSESAFVLRAPFAGTVLFRDGSPGDFAEPGHVFLRLADLSSLQAVVQPFERDGVRIDANARVRMHAAAHPGQEFAATYVGSGPEIRASSRTLPVRFAVPNPEGRLSPGMSVTAEVRLATAEGVEILAVPVAAVQRVERDWCVFVPRGGGRFERRPIARGRDLGGEVEVLSGLASDEEVVVEGAFVLRSESTRGSGAGDDHDH